MDESARFRDFERIDGSALGTARESGANPNGHDPRKKRRTHRDQFSKHQPVLQKRRLLGSRSRYV
ncbi:hypothetical protein D3C71_2134250 [compost metagenome]